MWHLLFTLKSWKLQFSGLLWLPSPLLCRWSFWRQFSARRRVAGGMRLGGRVLLANGFVRVSLSVRQHRPRTLFAFGKQCPEIMSLQHTPCPALPRPGMPFALALPLTKFALTSSSLPFHLASSSSSSSSSLSRFFAAAQLSRVSVLINVDSGFLFAVAVAYTRVYLVGGIKGIQGANNQQPPPPPPSLPLSAA